MADIASAAADVGFGPTTDMRSQPALRCLCEFYPIQEVQGGTDFLQPQPKAQPTLPKS